jgi:hypothetical protein
LETRIPASETRIPASETRIPGLGMRQSERLSHQPNLNHKVLSFKGLYTISRHLMILLSPERAAYHSPGQRPGVMQSLGLSPERAAQGHATFPTGLRRTFRNPKIVNRFQVLRLKRL